MDKNRANIKNAFTFAELMISLVVISILSAILYPTIAQFTPNSNKPLYKAAYRTLTDIVHEIVTDSINGEIPTDKSAITYDCSTSEEPDKTCNADVSNFCVLFCEKANITGNETCSNDCRDKILITSNGMRWYFDDYDVYKNPAPQNGTSGNNAPDMEETFKIIVDVNASNNNLSQIGVNPPDETFASGCKAEKNGKCGVFKFDNSDNERTGIYTSGGIPNYNNNTPAEYDADKIKVQDTFEIYINNKGKVINMSPAGWANLEDNENAKD